MLAEAVQELFPGTQITFGPATESGFYYDFHRAEHFTLEDFAKIEQRMREIVDRDEPITREVWERDQAAAWFKQHGETFKAEWVASIPKDEEISIYKQGNWLDMCTGPHLPSTGKLGKAFKLMKLSGAYWRGDANNPQLQRIYGTVFADEKQLKEHLHQLEEAEKRDHRRLGREMNLFHQQEEAAGMVFWHPKGWTLYRTLENFIRARAWTKAATRRSRRRSWSTASCGKPPATGRSSARTCISPRTRTASSTSPATRTSASSR